MASQTPTAPPHVQPYPGNPNPGDYCVKCAKKICTENRHQLMYYGCWCGSDRSPAGAMENQIPANEADWPGWVEKEGMPLPKDKVDECCMYHDLRLGQARQTASGSGAFSGSTTAAGINAKMSACLAKAEFSSGVSPWGRVFADYSTDVFAGMSGGNLIGSGWNWLTGASASAGGGSGFGSVGADGAASSAGASGSW